MINATVNTGVSMHRVWTPPRVLLVEDDEDLRSAVRFRLSSFGRVKALDDHQAALASLKLEAWNLVVTDVFLPNGGNGFSLARAVPPWVPVIVMTGNPTVEMTAAVACECVFRFLQKPLDWDLLDESVRMALDVSGPELQRWLRHAMHLWG